MARIPDATALGVRPTAVPRQQVAPDRSGEIIANALIQAGDAFSQKAAENKRKDDRFAYQKAKANLLQADLAAREKLKDIADYRTWHDKYQEFMTAAKDESAALISSESDRAMFGVEANLDVARGTAQVNDLMRGREIDDGQATLADTLEKNRTAALSTNDRQLRQQLVESSKQMILAAQENGYINAVQAEKMDEAWTRDTAEGFLVMMDPEERAKVLANPKGTIAEILAPDQRERLRRAALEEGKITRNRAASQAETDNIMEQHPESRKDALAAARSITDPDVRALAVSDINQRFNEVNAIRSEAARERMDTAANIVEEGGRIQDIPADVWSKLSVPERSSLEARQRQVQTGEEPINDDETYYKWTQLPQEEQAKANLLDPQWRANMDNAHYERAVARQQAILDAQQGNKNAQATLTSAVSVQQRIENSLLGGENPLFKRKPKPTEAEQVRRWSSIESAITDRIEQDSIAKGRKLSPQEIQQNVDAVVMDRYFVDGGWFSRDIERVGASLTAEQKADAYVPYDEIPERSRTRLENYARSLGLKPDEEAIGKAYAAGRLQMGDEQITAILRGD